VNIKHRFWLTILAYLLLAYGATTVLSGRLWYPTLIWLPHVIMIMIGVSFIGWQSSYNKQAINLLRMTFCPETWIRPLLVSIYLRLYRLIH